MTFGRHVACNRSGFGSVLLALALLMAAPGSGADKHEWQGVDRVVAIGDVHGDFDQFVRLLRAAGLIDERDRWSGGESHLVQTGDIPDRGPDSRKVMDLLMKLERQARKAGGFVHALIGNHEAMNVYGDLRYVSPGEFAAFRSPRSERLRSRFWEEHVRELQRNPPEGGLPEFDALYREKWEAEHPLGYFEHRLAFAPDGEYGKWIRSHNTVVRVDDTLFLHGGLGPKYTDFSLADINERVRRELRDFDKLRGGVAMDAGGPLWYRGLAQESEADLTDHLEQLLEKHGAKRIVMGHTPQPGAVMPRFDGKVVLIDVGLSEPYGGNLACLILEKGRPYALHRGERLPLPAASHGENFAAYLQKAASLDPSPSPLAPLIESLKRRQTTVPAATP